MMAFRWGFRRSPEPSQEITDVTRLAAECIQVAQRARIRADYELRQIIRMERDHPDACVTEEEYHPPKYAGKKFW